MADERVKSEREAEAENGAGEEGREHELVLKSAFWQPVTQEDGGSDDKGYKT